jgi:hypothetical protein
MAPRGWLLVVTMGGAPLRRRGTWLSPWFAHLPAEPIPLAAPGLAAVLARVGSAGAVVDKCATAAGNADS